MATGGGRAHSFENVLRSAGYLGPRGTKRMAQPVPGPCDEGRLDSHARWKSVSRPRAGRRFVIFAHGYVPNLPGVGLDFFDTLPDGTPVSTLVQSLGFVYATTSYRENGLAILEGADDVRELVGQFTSLVEPPGRTFMTGVSEGGLVAALLAERSLELFTGAFAACGPIGNFRSQVDYFGHFRVLFDYFFPGVFVGTPIDIHPLDLQRWLGGTTQLEIARRLAAEPAKALELMKTARAAFDPADVNTIFQTTTSVLQVTASWASKTRRRSSGGSRSTTGCTGTSGHRTICF